MSKEKSGKKKFFSQKRGLGAQKAGCRGIFYTKKQGSSVVGNERTVPDNDDENVISGGFEGLLL